MRICIESLGNPRPSFFCDGLARVPCVGEYIELEDGSCHEVKTVIHTPLDANRVAIVRILA